MLEPTRPCSLITERRVSQPWGLAGGGARRGGRELAAAGRRREPARRLPTNAPCASRPATCCGCSRPAAADGVVHTTVARRPPVTEHLWLQELRDRTIHDELDRQHPDRVQLRPKDVSGLARALDVRDAMWDGSIERAQKLPPLLLHERVGGESRSSRRSATCCSRWTRGSLGWCFGCRTHTRVGGRARLPRSVRRRARTRARGPCRAHRRIRDYLASATDADLSTVVSPPDTTGFPQTDHPVLYCFRVVLHDEWWHHQYATRDLDALRDR